MWYATMHSICTPRPTKTALCAKIPCIINSTSVGELADATSFRSIHFSIENRHIGDHDDIEVSQMKGFESSVENCCFYFFRHHILSIW